MYNTAYLSSHMSEPMGSNLLYVIMTH